MTTIVQREHIEAWEKLDLGFRVAMICTDNEGTVTHWSPYAATLYGWRREDALGRNIRDLTVGPDTAEVAEEVMASLMAGEHWEGEFQARRADGSAIEVHVLDMPLIDDGEQVGICGLSIDVTPHRDAWRRRLEESVRMFDAAERAREAERARVSREIHDEIGQSLTALRTELIGLTERGDSATGTAELDRVREAIRLADEALTSVRRISSDIRPPLLNDVGLVSAVDRLGETFTARTGVPCDVETDAEIPRLNPDQELEIFRIVQEALTNVERHADARAVRVSITNVGNVGDLVVEITDDGVGIPPHVTGGGGMTIMHARARRLGGNLTMQAAEPPATGTVVTLRWRPPFAG